MAKIATATSTKELIEVWRGEMLHTQALRDPGATVLVCKEEKSSYRELDTRVPRANGQPWRRWLVLILAWVGIFAVVCWA